MPALVLFGRKSRIGSDDLYIPSLLLVLYQVPIIAICVFYVSLWRRCSTMQFNASGMPFWYLLGGIPIFGFMGCIHLMVMHVSSKGSIIEHERRVVMPKVLHMLLLWCIIMLGYGAMGAYAWYNTEICRPDANFVLVSEVALLDFFVVFVLQDA